MPVHGGDRRHLGSCLGYVPVLAYCSCRSPTLRASDLHDARATILNPLSKFISKQEALRKGEPPPPSLRGVKQFSQA